MKKTVLTLSLMLAAGSAFASNTGFKLNYTLRQFPSKSNANWLSVPYFYYPTGVVGSTSNSYDLCSDLNEGDRQNRKKVTFVIKYDVQNDKNVNEACNSGLPTPKFQLVPGEGYAVKPAADNIVINVVGSHDDTFAKNKSTPTSFYNLRQFPSKSNANWFSVPYHITGNNSYDLCSDLNDGDRQNRKKVTFVIRYDTQNDKNVNEACNSGLPTPKFQLIPGEGYAVKPAADNIKVQTTVY